MAVGSLLAVGGCRTVPQCPHSNCERIIWAPRVATLAQRYLLPKGVRAPSEERSLIQLTPGRHRLVTEPDCLSLSPLRTTATSCTAQSPGCRTRARLWRRRTPWRRTQKGPCRSCLWRHQMMGQLDVQRPRYGSGDIMAGQGMVRDPGGWVLCHELKQGVKSWAGRGIRERRDTVGFLM